MEGIRFNSRTGEAAELSCSKLGQDNPGLVWNSIANLKALKNIWYKFFVYNLIIRYSKKKKENHPEKAFEERNKEAWIKI